MELIVLPLQCILVNTCMHEQPKRWGGGGGGGHQHPVPPCFLPLVDLYNIIIAQTCVTQGEGGPPDNDAPDHSYKNGQRLFSVDLAVS